MDVRHRYRSYSPVQSDISIFYIQCSFERIAHAKAGVCLYCKGLKKKRDEVGSGSLFGGDGDKKYNNLTGLKTFGQIFYVSDKKEHDFADLFLVLHW